MPMPIDLDILKGEMIPPFGTNDFSHGILDY